jgi:predicted nuclease of predicted toxin-antitoxin system
MRLLADECCDALLVEGLRRDGNEVLYMKEFSPGAADYTVLQLAASQQRVLLTEDKDFGELVVRLRLPADGIVLLRINPADSALKLTRLRHLLQHHVGRLPGSFTVGLPHGGEAAEKAWRCFDDHRPAAPPAGRCGTSTTAGA